MKILNVSFIGCGNTFEGIDKSNVRHIWSHSLAISKLKNKFKILGILEKDSKKADVICKKYNCFRYSNINEIINDTNIDLIVISSPTKTHLFFLKKLLKAKCKNILCEKPVGYDYNRAKKIVKKYINHKKNLFVNYSRLYDPLYNSLKKEIIKYKYGKLMNLIAIVDTALFMNSSHMISLVNYLAGKPISFSGFLDKKNTARVIERKKDCGGYLLTKHKNKIVSYIKAAEVDKTYKSFELSLFFEKGKIEILRDDRIISKYIWIKSTHHKGYKVLKKIFAKKNKFKNERMINLYNFIYNKIKKKVLFVDTSFLDVLKIINYLYKKKDV
jgi:predicted dehydrogenase